MIVGLDVSTRCVGYTYLRNKSNIHVEYCSYIKFPNRLKDLRDKFRYLADHLLDPELIGEDAIYIEEHAKFLPGKSNATTITKLAWFNGAVSGYLLGRGANVRFFNVATARKMASLPNVKGPYDTVKEHCYYELQKRFASQVPLEYTKPRGPHKPRLKPECMDATDSLCIALAGHHELWESQTKRAS